MTEILLIRHPETDLAGTFCGHSNPPINGVGEEQLRRVLESLRNERLDIVYSSDLQRARALAEALAKAHRIDCIPSSALREIDFGDWEALRWSQIEQRHPDEAAAWLASFPHRAAPNGEPFANFETRVLTEFDRILAAAYERVAIVTHAGVMRAILTSRADFEEETAWNLTKPYCSLVRFTATPVTVPQ